MNTDDIKAIIDRIANGQHTEEDVTLLQQLLTDKPQIASQLGQIASQRGKNIVNIGENKEIQIGDRIYYGTDAETIRTILQEVIFYTLKAEENSPLTVNWQQISRDLLQEYERLTTNPLTVGEGIVHRIDQVYVPLGLVERKQKTRREENVLPERGSELYQETEITQKFEHDEFLEQVLRQGKSTKSKGKRLAIIGEPGAGKTTLLQRIAQWLLQEIDGAVAIWVSLADLQGQELESYLLDRWLTTVARKLGEVETSKNLKNDFIARLNEGQVWLLLDGADEMPILSSNPLSEIARQVRIGSFLCQMRIIVTCRLNLWDSNRNALETFDTYRTLEFSYPEQVTQFIRQWFAPLTEEDENRSQRLCNALQEKGKERIRDLAKNPLRLTLLCFNWYLREGKLPETKAEFYQQFREDFYEWKFEQFPTTFQQRKELDNQLKELAREAIDKESNHYRLRHEFVCQFLGMPDDENSLFYLALKLGWLNKVGLDVANSKRFVYAFFHPTFQEYFAALAIDDWQFFLHHIPENPSHSNANYRIFEPQWKEIYLLWLGRENLDNKQKEHLIKSLTEFDDGCSEFNYYNLRAYSMASCGIVEFKSCVLADEIIQNLFQSFIATENDSPSIELLQAALAETDNKKLFSQIIKFIQENERDILNPIFHSKYFSFSGLFNEDDKYARKISRILRYMDSENLEALSLLKTFLFEFPCQAYRVSRIAVESLGILGYNQTLASNYLLDFLLFLVSPYLENQVIVVEGQEELVEEIKQTILDTKKAFFIAEDTELFDDSFYKYLMETLGLISVDNELVIVFLSLIMLNCKRNYFRLLSAKILGWIGKNNNYARNALVFLLEQYSNSHWIASWDEEQKGTTMSLVNWGVAGPIGTILQYTNSYEEVIKQAAISLYLVASENPNDINFLREHGYEEVIKTEHTIPITTRYEHFTYVSHLEREGEKEVEKLLEKYGIRTLIIRSFIEKLKKYQEEHSHIYLEHIEGILCDCVQNFSFIDYIKLVNLFKLANLQNNIFKFVDKKILSNNHIIFIDSSQLHNLDEITEIIYIEMVAQGCPESLNGDFPNTIRELQIYLEQLKKYKNIIFIVYTNPKSVKSEKINTVNELISSLKINIEVLKFLAKLDIHISIISEQLIDDYSIKSFSFSQTNLIENIAKWIMNIHTNTLN